MGEPESLDHFGRIVTEDLRDRAIDHFDGLVDGDSNAPGLQNLQRELGKFLPEHLSLIRRCVVDSIDNGIHDFLFKLQEQADLGARIKITVDGYDVAMISDGLHGEQLGDDGWFAQFSTHGDPLEKE